MGAYWHPPLLDPMVAGTLAFILVTWVTFAPYFYVLMGASYIEALRGNKSFSTALSDIHRRGGRRDTRPGCMVRPICTVR